MAYTTRRIEEKRFGELACRKLSPLARKYYDNTDPLTVLGLDDGSFKVEGAINEIFKNFDEMESAFEELQNEIENQLKREIIFKNYRSNIEVYVDGEYLHILTDGYEPNEDGSWDDAIESVVCEIDSHFNLSQDEIETVKEKADHYFGCYR